MDTIALNTTTINQPLSHYRKEVSLEINRAGSGTYRETLDMAIFMVKRNEKATSVMFSRVLRFVNLKWPFNSNA